MYYVPLLLVYSDHNLNSKPCKSPLTSSDCDVAGCKWALIKLFSSCAFYIISHFSIKQELQTGTYGPKALKEIPKPKAMRKKKKKRRAQSKESLLSDDSLDSGPGTPARPPPVADPRLYERRGQRRPEASSMERIIEEPPEYDGRTDTPESFQHPPVLYGTDNIVPPYQEQQSRPYPSQPGYYDNVLPQQQPYFYSDQPEMGAYYDNVPSPASPYIPDGDGYYMRSYPPQAASVRPPGQHDPRPGLEESEL